MPRRLRTCLAMLVLLLAAAAVWAAGPPPLFYGVISDVQRPADNPLAELSWAIDQVNAVHPDCVLWTGDLTANGTEAEYRNVMGQAKRLTSPVYYLPGNHECPLGETEYRPRFTQYTGQPPWQDIRLGGWHIILLDSVRIADGKLRHNGTVGEEELAWLKADLAGLKPDEPILLAAHHPFAVMSDGLLNAEEVLDLFRDRYLAYTVAGHFHYNRHDVDDRGVHHFVTGALSFSARPTECGLGYRLFSTVGTDLWTAWIETTDPAPLTRCLEATGPGRLKRPYLLAPLQPLPEGTQAVVRARYSGEGLALKLGPRTLETLPAATEPATALVILSPEDSVAWAAASAHGLTLEPLGRVSLESVAVYWTKAHWEHYQLRAAPAG